MSPVPTTVPGTEEMLNQYLSNTGINTWMYKLKKQVKLPAMRPGIKGRSTLAADSLPLSHQGSPSSYYYLHNTLQMTDTEVLSTLRIFPPSLSWIASSTLNTRCMMMHTHLKFITVGYLLFISTHQSLLTRDVSGFSQSILQGCLYVHWALLQAVLPLKGLLLWEYFFCHTFSAFSVVQWQASEKMKSLKFW